MMSASGYDVILKNKNKVYDGPGDDKGDGKPVIVVKTVGKGHVLITANNILDPISPPASIAKDVPQKYTIAAMKFFGNVLAWHFKVDGQVGEYSPILAVRLDNPSFETIHHTSYGSWDVVVQVYLDNADNGFILDRAPGFKNPHPGRFILMDIRARER